MNIENVEALHGFYKPIQNKYEGSTYVCKQNSPLNSNLIDGFTCYKMHDYSTALKFVKDRKLNETHRFSIVLVSQYLPMYFHKFYIDSYLKHDLWKSNITIMCKKDETNK